MKKIIIGVSFIIVTFQSGNAMDGFASFKDAVLGKKRDIQKEIETVKNDTSLNPADRAKQMGKLYGELSDKHHGKKEYAEYNHLMCRYNEIALELETKEKEAAAHVRELAEQEQRAQAQAERAEQERYAEETRLVEKIKIVRKDNALTHMQQWQELTTCYQRLLEIACANQNKEQYNLYQNRLEQLAQKKTVCALHDELNKTNNKSDQAGILRKIGTTYNNDATRAQEYIAKAQALEEEVKQECIAKAEAERDAKYQEASILLSLTTAAVEKIELYRRLVNSSASEQEAQKNNAQIKVLEFQIATEQKKEAFIDQRLKQISALSTLIRQTEINTTLVPFKRIDTLAGLLEKRATLSKGISALENNIAADLLSARKLRTQSIALAPDETTRLAIMRSMQ